MEGAQLAGGGIDAGGGADNGGGGRRPASCLTAGRRDGGEQLQQADKLQVADLAMLFQGTSGRLDQTELQQLRLLLQELEVSERTLGADHVETTVRCNRLALLLHKRGRFAEAESLLRRMVSVLDRAAGDHVSSPVTLAATTYCNLALVLHSQDKLGEAEAIYRRALGALLPDDHDAATAVCTNLGSMLRRQGRSLDEAEALLRRAVATYERWKPASCHPDVAVCCRDLGLLLLRSKEPDKLGEAEALIRRALSIREAALGPRDPATANSYTDLAFVLEALGRYDEAEALHRQALAACEPAAESDHLDASSHRRCNNLAILLYRQGRKLDEAEALLRRAVAIELAALAAASGGSSGFDNKLGSEAIISYNYLGLVLEKRGGGNRLDEAEVMYRQALAMCQRMQPDLESSDMLVTLELVLANVLKERDNVYEAEALLRRVLSISEAVHERCPQPQSAEQVATAYDNLGMLLLSQDRLAEAEALLRSAVAMQPAHAVGTLGSATQLLNLGVTLMALSQPAAGVSAIQQLDEAADLLDRALEIRTQLLGPDHPETSAAALLLSDVLSCLQDLVGDVADGSNSGSSDSSGFGGSSASGPDAGDENAVAAAAAAAEPYGPYGP